MSDAPKVFFFYIKYFNANIKVVLTAFIISYILLIFPVFLCINVKYKKEYKKLFYHVDIFSIKVLNGYIEIVKEGIAIHLTKRKAIIIPFKNMLEMRNKIRPLKDYHIIKLKLNVKFAVGESMILPISLTFLFNFALQFLRFFLFFKKPHVKVLTNFNVYENKDLLNINANATFVFNLLMVIISFIKIWAEKIYYAVKNRR